MSVPFAMAPDLPPLPPIIKEMPAPYVVYACRTMYGVDPGVLMLPIAGPEGTLALAIKTHATAGYRVVNWLAARLGKKVECPSPATLSPNDVLVSEAVSGILTGRVPDGSPVTVFSGSYVYGMFTPAIPAADNLYFGTGPWDIALAPESSLQPADFLTTILGQGAAIPSALQPGVGVVPKVLQPGGP